MSRVSGRLDTLKTSFESFADNISSNKLVTEGGIPGYFKNTRDFTGTINDPQIKVKLAQMNNSSNSLTKAEINGISEVGGEVRKLPGAVSGGENLSDVSRMMRGSNGNAGVIPKEIADNLRGRNFNNFDEFREAFWQEVGNSKYANEFGASNITRMKDGLAPIAQKSQQYGKIKSYVLHHMDPIYNGGGVYDLDNLRIVTPRFHQEILDKGFHFNK